MTTAEAIAQRLRIAQGAGRDHITLPVPVAQDVWKALQAITDKARASK